MKYTLEPNDKTTPSGKPLWRIKYTHHCEHTHLRNKYGGLIEKPYNLSQFGKCLILDEAIAMDDSRVDEDAIVSGESVIAMQSRILSHAQVFDQARILDYSIIGGWARIGGTVSVTGNSIINRYEMRVCSEKFHNYHTDSL